MLKRAAILLLTLLPLSTAAQYPTRLTYDVASIRPSTDESRSGSIKATPGGTGYTAHNINVRTMISLMYKIPARQIKGGPDWLDSDRYDVEARADKPYNLDDLHIMYQNLLADRFNLKFHKETREGNVYALEQDTPGSKMKLNESAQDFHIPITYAPDGAAVGVRVPMSYLAWWLGQQIQSQERPVIDLTTLDKYYDFTLAFAPVLPPGVDTEKSPSDKPSLFDALKQQLGLKLVQQRGPIDYYIIDHIDRPSDN
jgi:uncharacterized protein (TIGR03435 family)